jgi:hypothetical protein
VFWELRETVVAWLLMLALQLFTATIAFRFDGESLKPLWRLPLQQFAYRQLMYLVLIQSMLSALTGARLRWQKLTRAGVRAPDPELVPTLALPVPGGLPPAAGNGAGSEAAAARAAAGRGGGVPGQVAPGTAADAVDPWPDARDPWEYTDAGPDHLRWP